MEWISVNDKLPEPDVSVLALVETEPLELADGQILGERYYYVVARLRIQFRTNKPFWVNYWDYEPIETTDSVVTYWMPLPYPPQIYHVNSTDNGSISSSAEIPNSTWRGNENE